MAYSTAQKPGETLDQWYNRLAKSSDQRLVRLEKLSQQEGYKNADKWAYQSAMLDLEKWNMDRVGTDKPMRFNRNMPKITADMTAEQIKAIENQKRIKIRDMRNFLEMQTSTKSGIEKSLQKRVDTLNKESAADTGKGGYGTKFTKESLHTFYQRAHAKLMELLGDSDLVLAVVAEIQQLAEDKREELMEEGKKASNKDVMKAIKADMKKDTTTNLLSDNVKKALKARGIKWDELI